MDPATGKYISWLYRLVETRHSKGYSMLKEGVQDFFVRDLKVSVNSTDDILLFYKKVSWDSIFMLASDEIQAVFERTDDDVVS